MTVLHTNYGPNLRVTVSDRHEPGHVLWSVTQRHDSRCLGWGDTYPRTEGVVAGLYHASELHEVSRDLQYLLDQPTLDRPAINDLAVRLGALSTVGSQVPESEG